MPRQDIIMDQQWEDRSIRLAEKFGGLVRDELAKSAVMSMTLQTGVKIREGKLIYYKAGADEELEMLYTKVDFNDVSNVYDELEIPFAIEYSTKAIRISAEEWLQTYSQGGMDEQALRVKAAKVAKVISRVVMSLWLQGEVDYKGNTVKLGDGAIPVIDFKFATPLTGDVDRAAIAKEFDKFIFSTFLPQIEKIRNIGFKDPITGANAYDPYRTGVEVNSSIYTIATSQEFKSRYQIWSSHFNVVNSKIEDGSYGSIEGYALVQDIFLPLLEVKMDKNWTKNKNKYDQERTGLTTETTGRKIEFMFLKKERLIKGTVFDYTWSEAIPKTNGARIIGWNGRFGAGTIFPDEMFVINTGTAAGGGEEGGEGEGTRIAKPTKAEKVQADKEIEARAEAQVEEILEKK